MIEEEHVTFETAKLAKEKGFNEECLFYYEHLESGNILWKTVKSHKTDTNFYLAPSQSILARWLRDSYKVIVSCAFNYETKKFAYFIGNYDEPISKSSKEFDFYEEALESGLQEALKLI